MRRRPLRSLILALFVGLLVPVTPTSAAVPARPQIVDAANDANGVNDQAILYRNSYGEVSPPGAAAGVVYNGPADIRAAWFTNDALNVSAHLHVGAATSHDQGGIAYFMTADPASMPDKRRGCLTFWAIRPQAEATITSDMDSAFVNDGCKSDPNAPWTFSYAAVDVAVLPDATQVLSITVPRAFSPVFRGRFTLTRPLAGARHNTSNGWTRMAPYLGLSVPSDRVTYPVYDVAGPGSNFTASATTRATGLRKLGRLGVGESRFWDGGVMREKDNDALLYELNVAPGGKRLRIGVEQPLPLDWYAWVYGTAYAPDGTAHPFTQDRFGAHIESFIANPKPGRWLIHIRPSWFYGERTALRFRAKLERTVPKPAARSVLLPNLRPDPPYDFSFQADYGGILPVESTPSCFEDEQVEDGARRCLRLGTGIQNIGAGRLEMRFGAVSGPDARAPMKQIVYRGDGTSFERSAGTAVYHKTHQHFHFETTSNLESFRVTDRRTGAMTRAGIGHKMGFCFVDISIAEFRRFAQEPAGTVQSDCGYNDAFGTVGVVNPTGGLMGISAGWSDLYNKEVPGNYVEFSGQPDGFYVVRATVDKSKQILESNEGDNVAYSYVHIAGDRVTLLERGYGTSPWDRRKQVLSPWYEFGPRR